MIYYTKYNSPVGELTLASDGSNICGLWLNNQKYFGAKILEGAQRDDSAGGFSELKRWFDEYFKNPKTEPQTKVPLKPKGSEFQQAVWKKLTEIPYGKTTTYGDISNKLKAEGIKASAIAVGGAVGHNPISIIIPCHRVIGSSGKLTGFAGGLDRKKWLLVHEGYMIE
jgi:methylated-DNA-[protein]-cysteine S-methyltransferase